ncbi:PREDICTED: uncharacterized protein LOC109172423 [Ipomoea nil]|uniref:uncharacterized protein LOC109172423 n=1 Tax=Ipomoea nil TaxID=35883 RepID=UPI000900F41F|nr:PREDICTED: uncharacterized protein LOC109172423 [Ipomoea nil]
MKQPQGYEDSTHPGHVCLLQWSLYGLKQAPKAWFKGLHDYLLSVGFASSKTDVSLFYYTVAESRVYLLVYVDDIIIVGSGATLVGTILQRLASTFKIRDLGKPGFFLGIETVDSGCLSIVGALQYLTITHPDLSYAVNRLCQFMHSPSTDHWAMVKRVLRYIKGTLDYGLCLSPSSTTAIHAYSDSDWASYPVDRKSTSGFAVFLGSNLVS